LEWRERIAKPLKYRDGGASYDTATKYFLYREVGEIISTYTAIHTENIGVQCRTRRCTSVFECTRSAKLIKDPPPMMQELNFPMKTSAEFA
jgi:hypothetical protein